MSDDEGDLTKRLRALDAQTEPHEAATDAFMEREAILDRTIPALSFFFHVVRCPKHEEAEKREAYEAACVAFDELEAAHIAVMEADVQDQFGGAPEAPKVKMTVPMHPGSKAIN